MYDQECGVSLGSPVAPILAFIRHQEKKLYNVDDIFCLFDDNAQTRAF